MKIAVLIIRSEFGEALPGHRPKQFPPIVDLSVVVAIQGEKTAVGTHEGNLIPCPSKSDSRKCVNTLFSQNIGID